MKIERISDNQIRCTLNKADLADRELLLNELAYGTEKAKALFRDMMQQASYELGFEAEDIPLMIEAIPVSPECLILVITKVDDPEELDTRFSKFSKPSDYNDDDLESEMEEVDEYIENSDSIQEMFSDIDDDLADLSVAKDLSIGNLKALKSLTSKVDNEEDDASSSPVNIYKIYLFPNLSSITQAAGLVHPIYHGENTLYKNQVDNKYYLIVYKSDHKASEYNQTCNILSEYGHKIKNTYATCAYFDEHFQPIIKEHAIQVLSDI